MLNSPYSSLQDGLRLPSPVQKITSAWFLDANNIDVYCKRDDLIHNIISGNKWRKLMPLAEQLASYKTCDDAHANNHPHILSFGGAYSNHLHALGYLCHRLNIRFTAIIRGDYSQSPTPMLADIVKWNTHCQFVTKVEYKKRTDAKYVQQLKAFYNADIVIPEGGSSQACLQGVASLVDEYHEQAPNLSHVILPVASGGTMAGIIAQHEYTQRKDLYKNQRTKPHTPLIIGVAALKSGPAPSHTDTGQGMGYLEIMVVDLVKHHPHFSATAPNINWHIEHDYHHGGYAKSSPALHTFMKKFTDETGIEVETVYSGKCFYALHQMIKQKYFCSGSRILAIHTGGLQGARKK